MPAGYAQYEERVITALQERTHSTAELEDWLPKLAAETGYDFGGIPLDLLRMNTVGTLRANGWVIPKKRGEYSITGFEPKVTLKHVELWPADKRETIKWFENDLAEPDYETMRWRLARYSQEPIHGFAPLQVMGYEMSRDTGRVLADGSLALRKFENYPRFRIALPGLDIKRNAQLFSTVSVRPLTIVSVDEVQLRALTGIGDMIDWSGGRHEAVYNCKQLWLGMEDHLNSRGRTTFRKNQREIEFKSFKPEYYEDAKKVIQIWKTGPAGIKQRQLAIGRDFKCLDIVRDTEFLWPYTLIGWRGDNPVSLHIGDPLPGAPDYVAQLVEKSLNYSSLPGGYNGVTNANLWAASEQYLALGHKYIQGGDYLGGTEGLVEHKQMLADRSKDVKHRAYTFRGLHYTPEPIEEKP